MQKDFFEGRLVKDKEVFLKVRARQICQEYIQREISINYYDLLEDLRVHYEYTPDCNIIKDELTNMFYMYA